MKSIDEFRHYKGNNSNSGKTGPKIFMIQPFTRGRLFYRTNYIISYKGKLLRNEATFENDGVSLKLIDKVFNVLMTFRWFIQNR